MSKWSVWKIVAWLVLLSLAWPIAGKVTVLEKGWLLREAILTGLASANVRLIIESAAFVLLVLHALFGLGEVARGLPLAWSRFVDNCKKREFRKLAYSAYWVFVAVGPMYIAVDFLEKIIGPHA